MINFYCALFNFVVAGFMVVAIASGRTDTYLAALLYINVILGIINLHIHATNLIRENRADR